MEFGDVIVNGVSLSVVVFALVELIKQFGVSGKWLTVASFAIGLVLAVGYQLTLGIPMDFAGWFGVVIFGLSAGLIACKGYDGIRNASNPNDGLG